MDKDHAIGSSVGAQGKGQPRGFAALSQARRSEIAGLGGRTAHALGRAHEFTPEEARNARAKRTRAAAASMRVELP